MARHRAAPRLEFLEPRRVLTQVSGSIDTDTLWTVDQSPYEVTGDITIRPDATLSIDPGVVVQFRENTRLNVRGRLLAEGTPWNRITFDRAAGASDWEGLKFEDTLEDNRITFIDMHYGDSQGEAIDIEHSRLLIANATWTGTTGTILELDHPSLIVRNSQFPQSNGGEIIHGEQITDEEYLIIEGNVFANSNNGGDVIDFLGAERPGPVVQILNNAFLGGGDDGLDLDGTDAHIEGNLFANFRKNTGRNTTANAIATGLPQNGDPNRTEVTIVRNVFVNNDHALLLKEDAFAAVKHNLFLDSQLAVIQFNEAGGTSVRGVGKGATLDGNIFWNNNQLFKNLIDQPEFRTQLTVDRSLLPNETVDFGGTDIRAHDLGQGNLEGDPRLVNASRGDYRLLPNSPAVRRGPAGRDMGPLVWNEPTVVQASAIDEDTLEVSGPGVTHYRYRANDGTYGSLTSVDVPIELNPDDITIDVLGMNSAGEWIVSSSPTFGDKYAELVAPRTTRANEHLPFIIRIQDWADRPNTLYTAAVQLDNAAELNRIDYRVKKGMGSGSPLVKATSNFDLTVSDPDLITEPLNVEVLNDAFPSQEYSGALVGDIVWDSSVERRITGDLTISANSSLTLLPGTRVLLGDKVNVRVMGRISALGTAEDPILFNAIDRATPWGGIELADATADFEYTFFTQGGADVSREFGHSNSQAVLRVERSTLTCDHCFLLNNVGKAFGSRASRLSIDHSVISDVDTGGEFMSSVTHVSNSWIKDISDGQRDFVDDDNDGFYFAGASSTGEASRLENSIIIDTKDDGIDHNGAILEVVGSWVQGAFHEGIAGSRANTVNVADSVFVGHNQGIEAGYGAPEITVSQSVLYQNRQQIDPRTPITAGLRFGDGYDGRLGAYEGHIAADHVVLYENGDNVRNYDGSIPGPKEGAIEVTRSLTNDVDVDGQAGNITGPPLFGPQMHLLRGSPGFTSGPDGLPIGRSLRPVRVLTAPDFNDDGVVDHGDVDLFCAAMRSAEPDRRFDFTGDGVVDESDRDQFILRMLDSTYGDANLDGMFNSSDLVQVFVQGEYEDGMDNNSGWADGDWDCDGEFSTSDLVLAFQSGNYLAAVEAPTSIALAPAARIVDEAGSSFASSPSAESSAINRSILADRPVMLEAQARELLFASLGEHADGQNAEPKKAALDSIDLEI